MKQTSVAVRFAAYFLIAFFLYATLVFSDYLVARVGDGSNLDAVQIESARHLTEDVPQRNVKLRQGYTPIFYPEMIESKFHSPYFRSLALKYDVAPLAGQPNASVYLCNEGYGLVTFQTDRYGFRNENDQWDRDVDVALIGDSFVHGACVEQVDTIASNLDPTWNVVNLGSLGNDPVTYSAIIKSLLPDIRPKYVVMFFYANDNNVYSRLEDSYYYNYYFGSKDVKSRGVRALEEKLYFDEISRLMMQDIDKKQETVEVHPSILDRGSVIRRAARYLDLPHIRGLLGSYSPNSEALDPSSKLAIETLRSECVKQGCRPLVVYIPNSSYWRPDSRSGLYEVNLQAYTLSAGVSFWSAKAVIDDLGGNFAYAIKGPHLSPLGYRVVAKELRKRIDER